MELVQVINGVERMVDEARDAYNDQSNDEAASWLCDAAGLVQRELGESDEVSADTPDKEEKADTRGQDERSAAE